MNRVHADLALLLVAFIWGTAFIAQKYAVNSIGPVTFVGFRFLLSFLALSPLAFYECNKKNGYRLTKRDLGLASSSGVCLFLGAVLQQIGLVTTTATNGGFLTALYVIFVPFVVWMISGEKPRLAVLIGVILSSSGAWFLTEGGEFRQWTSGDICILIADVAWAVEITLVSIILSRTNRPFFLAFSQYGVTATVGLIVGFGFEPFSEEGLTLALPAVLYAGFFSAGIANTLQIYSQKYTPPAEASLIMSLESVFAAISGAALLSERLTSLAVIGCTLILLGVIFVEAGPAISKTRAINNLRKLRPRL